MIKVSIYQTSPVLLDVKTNLEEVILKINRGREKGIHLNVFPEMALTGYFVGPEYHEAALRLDSREIRSLVSATRGTAAVVGFIEESPSMNFYNSALVAVDGEILFAYRKLNLPNYGVFEERKYFANGKHVRVFKFHDMTISVFICNDMWHPALPYLGVCQKADVFISIFNSSETSMSPEFSNIESWEIINKFYSRIFGIYNICANRVGEEMIPEKRNASESETEKKPSCAKSCDAVRGEKYKFWGGSEIINPFGQRIYKAAYYRPDEIIGDLDKDILRRKKIMLPYLRNDDPYFTDRELHRILYGANSDFQTEDE
ncbi:nitrilase-related carbon-nitrogen hydrolase [Desulfonema magnum]|uniref:Carbon-nitrogen hydrolase family protein n=1 Tax=Desulfonema magnum TaxID=45655 RepID=A0A975BGZ5_9BACT|nr:nitrilase-related carbon-nitrogen hydrolase [Desulfonema magnum]QTA85206.1 Carbon-nitrogen hydrolase family protein [Desulfonema magnum]